MLRVQGLSLPSPTVYPPIILTRQYDQRKTEMEVGSSSSSAAQAAAPQIPQIASKLVGRPYRKRAKNAVLNNPTLEQVMGSKEKALDVSTSRPLV